MSIFNLFNTQNKLSPEQVSEYYKVWTGRYIKSFGDTFQSHRPDDLDAFFQYLLNSIDIKPGMSVVDAGCGIGGPVFGLAKLTDAQFAAINVSDLQLEIAETRKKSDKVENVKFIKSDFHNLSDSIESESVDRLYFLESLVHSDNLDKVISEARKILKSNGKIYVKDLFERVPYSREDARKIKESIKINNKLFKLFVQPKEQLLLVLRKHGFKLEFCKLLDIDANQDVGNQFVLDNNLVKDMMEWHPYLEWYEIRASKITSEFD